MTGWGHWAGTDNGMKADNPLVADRRAAPRRPRPKAVPQAQPLPPLKMARRSFFWPFVGFAAGVCVPALLAALYFYTIAVDRYVSEFRYAVRGGAIQEGSDDVGGVLGAAASALQMAGDSFILEDYLVSPAALADLEARVPLREMLDRDGDDPVRGYEPTIAPEELLEFWESAITVTFDVITGITTVTVSAYHPDDSRRIADALVEMLDRLVDQLSEEAQTEMLAFVDKEFATAETRLAQALAEIEDFRRRNRVITPEGEGETILTMIAQLTDQLTDARVRLRTLRQNVPNSPQISVLEKRIESLLAQISAERDSFGGGPADQFLPEQLNEYERLENQYQIARDTFVSTLELRQQAQANAELSRVQLVVFVTPRRPILSTMPIRWLEVLKYTGIAFAIWLVLRIFTASLRTP